jgi:hypothetical protein
MISRSRTLILSFLIIAAALLWIAAGRSRPVMAAEPRYYIDVVQTANNPRVPVQNRAQALIDQRTAEGWELMGVSAYPESENAGVNQLGLVLSFKRR